MLKKVCPQCGQASYSASEFGLWICPSCEHNLRYIPTEPAGAIDDITECFWWMDAWHGSKMGLYVANVDGYTKLSVKTSRGG